MLVQPKTVTTNLGLEGHELTAVKLQLFIPSKTTLAGYMLEEPSIILRLSCLLHVFIIIIILIDVLLYTCTATIIINAKCAGTRP